MSRRVGSSADIGESGAPKARLESLDEMGSRMGQSLCLLKVLQNAGKDNKYYY